MIISIDIGTSYSSVCMKNKEGKAEPVETSTGISIYGSKYSLPSAVFVEEDGNILVGQAAMNSRRRMPQNFRSEFKRDLGQNIPIVLGNRSFLPEELYAEMFRHMAACAQKSGTGNIEKAFITYPASYGKSKREKIQQAAKNAGLFDTELIDEPTAAAMCYGAKGCLKDGDILLVYDFGGGTFDVSVIRYTDGAYEPLAPAMGIEHCGGIDIDRAIYLDMVSKIDSETLKQLSANPTNKMRFEGQLAELAVKIKHHLSVADYAKEVIPVGFDILDYELSRGKLNEMIADTISQTIVCCKNLLDNAGTAVHELSGILLVGGTSRVPLVSDMVHKFAGSVPVYTNADPDLAVALGALEQKRQEKNSRRGGTAAEAQQEKSKTDASGFETPVHGADEREAENNETGNFQTEDVDEQYRLGQQYEEKQNYEQAAEWYSRAARNLYTNAAAADTDMEGIFQDRAAGVEEQAAKSRFMNMWGSLAGNADAKYNYGLTFEAEKNYAKAAESYLAAANQGHASAQYRLGLMCESGQGVTQDYVRAAEWYRRAAGREHASACNNLGVLYKEGKGVRQDYAKAVEWYQKAAGKGHAAAQYNLGVRFYEGLGVKQDYAQAMEYFQKAVKQGVGYAGYNLGIGYFAGKGVEQDYAKAAEYFAGALAKGCLDAGFYLGVLYEAGRGVEQDYAKAADYFQMAAQIGNRSAQYQCGILYHNGKGVNRDYIKASEWYRKAIEQEHENTKKHFCMAKYRMGQEYESKEDFEKAAECYQAAAEQGYASAQTSLGILYMSGQGVSRDYGKALEWFGKADEQGDAFAKYHLGILYYKGNGTGQDYAKAAEYFQEAANQGDVDAQYHLGMLYKTGQGVEKDDSAAIGWFAKAAKQGHVAAQYNLGVLYYKGMGVAKDDVRAAGCFEAAAKQGEPEASNHLGLMYETGRGVAQDYNKAAEWYGEAAELGNANAQYNFALMHYEGVGIGQDYARAAEWFEKAAGQGLAAAQYNLGVMYETGQEITQDYSKAAEWYEKAAMQDNTDAQMNLASLYADGKGVEKDLQKAVYWYQKAQNKEREIVKRKISRVGD